MFFQEILKADRCFGEVWQILHRLGDAGFTESLVAHLNIGTPIILASDVSSWFTNERFNAQFPRINLVRTSDKHCHSVLAAS